ncbi:alkaline phosphatase [Mytilus galloprovincialis]|uniref:Alkaline phosphatase, tissue-nonspecific isozyme n=1 Tax=Mytilus galloprovincialis TaxID=29158 RepID=A0A8B6D595_MYTGA|nr:alkaline phosphatase [Mytilus galloprovincialis]
MAYRTLTSFLLVCVSYSLCQGQIVPPETDWDKLATDSLNKALKQTYNTNLAKNIILFIGDGMGVSTVTAARIYKGQKQGHPGEETILKFEEFPHVALSKTYGNDRQVPDSAQTATALMSGYKTNFYIVGFNDKVTEGNCSAETEENKLKSILHHFNDAGRSTGVVTTARLTHATPASSYANSANRDWEYDAILRETNVAGNCKDIAYQLVYDNSYIQVAMGGGRTRFLPNTTTDTEDGSKGKRTDGLNLVSEWQKKQNEKGRRNQYVTNKLEFDRIDPATTDSVLGLFESSHMQYEVDRNKANDGEPSLEEMTEKAIKILKKNTKGFFLLVEGGRIDHGHHDNTAKRALEEVLTFENAVRKAIKLTNQEETLIIVTADHSHVFSIGGYPYRGNDILGLANPLLYEPSLDKLPYTTISYGNGPGMNYTIVGRQNITGVDTTSDNYVQQSAVPVASESHGGEDVPIFAMGPMSHLIHGVQEQHYVGHVMQFAACVGKYSNNCDRKVTNPHSASSANEIQFSFLRMIIYGILGVIHSMCLF